MDTTKVKAIYNRIATQYESMEAVTERFLIRHLRRRVVAEAAGKILEIGTGTGLNLPHYRNGASVVGSDLSIEMIRQARRKSRTDFTVMDAQKIGFRDGTFDTVISTLTMCTIPDPVRALREMMRVCKPGGRILLLEHGRSDFEPFGLVQDMIAPFKLRQMGCHYNRMPLEILRRAGTPPARIEKRFFGIFIIACVQMC